MRRPRAADPMAHAMTSFETPPPSGAKSTAAITSHDAFGSKVPLAEPSWYQHLNTPFYNASHVAWRNKLRDVATGPNPSVDIPGGSALQSTTLRSPTTRPSTTSGMVY